VVKLPSLTCIFSKGVYGNYKRQKCQKKNEASASVCSLLAGLCSRSAFVPQPMFKVKFPSYVGTEGVNDDFIQQKCYKKN